MGSNTHTCQCAKESICGALLPTDGLLLLIIKYKKEVKLASSGVSQK